MHVAGVEEQLCLVGGIDKGSRRIEVALAREFRVGIHPVYLDRHAIGPSVTKLGDREAGVEEQGTPSPLAGLGELLGGHHAHRESRVDQFRSQRLGLGHAAVEDGVEPDRPGVGNSLLERREGLCIEEVGRVHDVAGRSQLVGEVPDPGGQTHYVMEQHDFGHGFLLA